MKTVSNALFVSESELLTVGTDNTAKLWDLHRTVCTNTFEENIHELCFVGVDNLDYLPHQVEDNFGPYVQKHASKSIVSKRLHLSTSWLCSCIYRRISTVEIKVTLFI